MPAAALSLAKTSEGVPAGPSAMLAAAAFQSTCTSEIRGVFSSCAGAAPAINSAHTARMARFKPLPRFFRVSQGLCPHRQLRASNRSIQGSQPGVGCARTTIQGQLPEHSGKMTVREANLTPVSSADREPKLIESGGTARLHLTLATTDYDHVRDLVNGVIRPEGIALTAFVLPVEEIFYRFIKNREWDVSEMSFGKFIGYASQGNSPFVGIPVFPSRVFRHSAFYIRSDRGIGTVKDLEGKRVGIPEWAQTAGIYARGFLSETANVDLRKIHWVQAGMNEPGREEKVGFELPAGIKYEQRRDTSISAMLLSGEVDAAISARVPDAFEKGGGKITRLYPDYRSEEMRYHAATGIFPIMHVIAVRRAVFDRYPWVAMNLFK